MKLLDAMIDSCRYQGYLRSRWCSKRLQCVYYCSFLTGQNILAGLSASASEIGLVRNFRARAWHSTSDRYAWMETPQDRCFTTHSYSYTLSSGHQGQTWTSSGVTANVAM